VRGFTFAKVRGSIMMSSSIDDKRFATLKIREVEDFYQQVILGGVARGFNDVIAPILSDEGESCTNSCGQQPSFS
jgi:hypothetical protein